MNYLLYIEINLLCITLLGIMAYRASKFGIDTNSKKNAFVATICSAIVANVFDIFRGLYISSHSYLPVWLCCAICIGYFLSLAMSSFFWFIFSEIVHTRKFDKIRLIAIFLIPIAILVALLLTTNKTKLLFYFGDDGKFIRGSLYYLQFVPSLFYIIVSSVKSLKEIFALENFERNETFKTIFFYSVPAFFCTILQFFFPTAPVISVFPTISVLLIYTNSLKIQLSLDSLTGIFNRKELIHILTEKTKSAKKNKRLYFIFLDIDDFKTLNDKYGHNDGDKALQLVADALNEVCYTTGGSCARYGGDEFAVVQELYRNMDINALCKRIKDAVATRGKEKGFKFPINVSIGYAEFGHDAISIPSLIRFADKQMYANKQNLKKVAKNNKEFYE